jgi:PIN domain nuclease of toxin-antitoxin system
VRLLLDTHAALWWLAADSRIGHSAARELRAENEVLLSSVVVWEIAIKRSIGKLTAREDAAAILLERGARALPVTLEHAAAVETLPLHHRDPFDRMLIAQAQLESAAIVARDGAFSAYDVQVIW